MFKVVAYKNGRFYDERKGKNATLAMLTQETREPDRIKYNKRTVNYIYYDGKFTEVYTLPIEFSKKEGK